MSVQELEVVDYNEKHLNVHVIQIKYHCRVNNIHIDICKIHAICNAIKYGNKMNQINTKLITID